MSSHKPPFILRSDIDVDQVIYTLIRLTAQSKAIQASMTELSSGKKYIVHHWEEINELATQVESNLADMCVLTEWLDARKIEEVKP